MSQVEAIQFDLRATEIAAGRWLEKNCGLAAGKIAASRQLGRKNNAAKPLPPAKGDFTTYC